VGYSQTTPDFRKIFGGEQSSGSAVATSKTFEHVISATIIARITLRVCYFGSQTCVTVQVPGYGHQQASLGLSPGQPGFRYQYTEQF
jgi:hypothetical protein